MLSQGVTKAWRTCDMFDLYLFLGATDLVLNVTSL